MIKPATWLRIRLIFYALGFASGLFGQREPEIWSDPFFIVIGGIGVLIAPFVFYGAIALQGALPGTRPRTRPTHAENPFQLTNFVAFLYFAAHYIGAYGCGVIISACWQGWPTLVQGLCVLLGAAGALLAVRMAVKRYDGKVQTSLARKPDAAQAVGRGSWSKGMLILGWVSLISGTIFVIGAGSACFHTRNFLTSAQRAEGRVVELVERQGTKATTYGVVYTFSDAVGAEHKCSSQGSYPAKYKVGDVVEVLFDPNRPQKARINSYFELWGLATILAVVGGADCILGPLFIYFAKRLKKRAIKSVKAGESNLCRNQELS